MKRLLSYQTDFCSQTSEIFTRAMVRWARGVVGEESRVSGVVRRGQPQCGGERSAGLRCGVGCHSVVE